MAHYSSSELERLAEAVSQFLDAAELLLQDRGDRERQRALAKAAGRAAKASETANALRRHAAPPAAGGRAITYDPIVNWNMEIDPFTDHLQDAIDHAFHVLGTLEAMALEAKREERSLVGRIGKFAGFPSAVRKYLADRGHPPRSQSAGFWTGVAIQLVSAALLAAAVAFGVDWLAGLGFGQ